MVQTFFSFQFISELGFGKFHNQMQFENKYLYCVEGFKIQHAQKNENCSRFANNCTGAGLMPLSSDKVKTSLCISMNIICL